ncbi:hypothetical protein ACFWP2_29985 [Kitasatospora sp. NPDC058444]|uniref:hypothetical protein n=1 Tax=Kitasatospora sp. NPDC058444 TaxID=3346504 RepID=UPI00365910BF
MLPELLTAAAAAGGGAIVQAAGTDAWNGVRDAVARLLGRSEARREQAESERLDRTRAVLEAAAEDEAERVRAAQTAVWQTRFEVLLEELPDAERRQVVSELERLAVLAEAARPAETVHNDFRGARFDRSQVQGSGTMNVTNNHAE